MTWIVGGVAAVTLVMAAVAVRVLTAGRHQRIDTPEEAAAAAEEGLPGFATEGAVVGADGEGALVVDRDGRVAVMKRAGKRIAVREVAWSTVRSTGDGIVIETGERRFGSVALRGVDALDIRRLAPADTRRLASALPRV